MLPYLHAGAGVIVREADIIGIFDLDGKITTADTADFLRRAERDGKTETAGDDLPKCFLLVAPPRRKNFSKKKSSRAHKTEKIVFSHISARHLSRRNTP